MYCTQDITPTKSKEPRLLPQLTSEGVRGHTSKWGSSHAYVMYICIYGPVAAAEFQYLRLISAGMKKNLGSTPLSEDVKTITCSYTTELLQTPHHGPLSPPKIHPTHPLHLIRA